MALQRVIVAGGSIAGLNVVEKIREIGCDAEIVLIGEEPSLPYDRPPLSKEILRGEWTAEKAALRSAAHYDDLDVDMRLGSRAEGLDVRDRIVRLSTGECLTFDRLVIATGVRPRTLPNTQHLKDVHILRTLEDSHALRAAFTRQPKVVIVGAGFIGAEVAAAARSYGLDVTLVDTKPILFSRVVGPKVGARSAALHAEHGVKLRLGMGIAGILGENRVEAVRLTDGTVLPADVLVVGIGAEPCTDWLASSGLSLDNGIVCDEYCAAGPGIYAAGDVCRWQHRTLGRLLRVEHWANAVEQGRAVAVNLFGNPESLQAFTPTPYFWSDQFGKKFQFIGSAENHEEEVMIEDRQNDRFAGFYKKGGRVCGAMSFNWPRAFVACRDMVVNGKGWDEIKKFRV